jgi:hypothetical protein
MHWLACARARGSKLIDADRVHFDLVRDKMRAANENAQRVAAQTRAEANDIRRYNQGLAKWEVMAATLSGAAAVAAGGAGAKTAPAAPLHASALRLTTPGGAAAPNSIRMP